MDSILTVLVQAANYDLVDLEDVKEELGDAGDANNSKQQRWITEESARIATYIGRILHRETVSEAFRFDGFCRMPQLRLTRRPVASISSVTDDGTLLSASDYEVDPKSGLLTRLSGDIPTYWSGRRIVVEYVGGYASGEIPPDIQAECMTLVKHRAAAASRDPSLRSIRIDDVSEKTFWVGQQGDVGDLPPAVVSALTRYCDFHV